MTPGAPSHSGFSTRRRKTANPSWTRPSLHQTGAGHPLDLTVRSKRDRQLFLPGAALAEGTSCEKDRETGRRGRCLSVCRARRTVLVSVRFAFLLQ